MKCYIDETQRLKSLLDESLNQNQKTQRKLKEHDDLESQHQLTIDRLMQWKMKNDTLTMKNTGLQVNFHIFKIGRAHV